MEALPIQQSERAIIVDIVRGFALVGVLIANFTGYAYENLPSGIFNSISSSLDKVLNDFNTIFLEWKFFTIFSILFGYSFGLILSSLEKKSINPVLFFARRMGWLFVIGIIHASFWWGDVLHFYAISGLLLLPFRKFSDKSVLWTSLILMFCITPVISFLFRNQPDYFSDQNLQQLYEQYKHGNIIDVVRTNIRFNYYAFIASGSDIHDIAETLGRFLFGYYLLRIKLFESVKTKRTFFIKALLVTAPVVIAYFIVRWMLLRDMIDINEIIREPIMKIGILSTSCFYVSTLVLMFIRFGQNKFFSALQALGTMALTNYLLISAFCVLLLYGIGFGKLGIISMHTMWISAFVWLIIEIVFSTYWLKQFRYGPMEWIWRQLTYRKKIQLRK
jgi:uncharacterized protein